MFADLPGDWLLGVELIPLVQAEYGSLSQPQHGSGLVASLPLTAHVSPNSIMAEAKQTEPSASRLRVWASAFRPVQWALAVVTNEF